MDIISNELALASAKMRYLYPLVLDNPKHAQQVLAAAALTRVPANDTFLHGGYCIKRVSHILCK